MNILITGANGQLGQDFQLLFREAGVDFTATDYAELDITNTEAIRAFVTKQNYSHIINCAAYNDVDKAETEKDLAYSLNCSAPTNLAIAAKEINAVFATYSTDFVFDGKKVDSYTEKDKPTPLSVYAKSKKDGEEAALEAYKHCFVIRTSWLFGLGNNNFNKQIIHWSENNVELSIVDDQISVPTYSKDLARLSWDLLQTEKYGLYHLSNGGICSKFDQAEYVLKQIGWQGTLKRSKTRDYNLPAIRPAYSKLCSEKAEKLIGKTMPSWQNAIDRFLQELGPRD